jgi:hypothetical protein
MGTLAMLRASVFASAMLLLASVGYEANATPPPPIAIHETKVVSFTTARFEFTFPDVREKGTVIVRTSPASGDTRAKIDGIELVFGRQSVAIDSKLLDDINTPNLLRLSATVVPVQSGEIVFVLYLIDDSAACSSDAHPTCGIVEFDWKVGGRVEKLDGRK